MLCFLSSRLSGDFITTHKYLLGRSTIRKEASAQVEKGIAISDGQKVKQNNFGLQSDTHLSSRMVSAVGTTLWA